MEAVEIKKEQKDSVHDKLPWQKILLVFSLSRGLILLGIILSQHPFVVTLAKDAYILWFNSAEPTGSVYGLHPLILGPPTLQNILGYWDGFWYLKLATEGYQFDGTLYHQTVSHYPLFSMFSAALAYIPILLGLPKIPTLLWSGMLLNNISFLLSLLLLYRIISRYATPRIAMTSVTVYSLYPGALYTLPFLSEGLFLLMTLGFFWSLIPQSYGKSVVFAALANLTRVNGALLVIPYLQHIAMRNLIQPKPFLILVLLLVGMALYPLYLYWQYHDPWIYFKIHSVFRGDVSFFKMALLGVLLLCLYPPLGWFPGKWQKLSQWCKPFPWISKMSLMALLLLWLFYCGPMGSLLHVDNVVFFRELPGMFATLGALVVFALYRKGLPSLYSTYGTVSLLLLFYSGTFLSNQRYMLAVFPVFWCLGLMLQQHTIARKLFYALSGVSLTGLTVLYASQGWIFLF
jgi:hypothetical protein